MKRNCNLELPLVTMPSVFSDSSAHEHSYQFYNMLNMEDDQSPNQKQKQHQLTVFYNGRIAASDVTEFQQARAIILLASGEMEDEKRSAIPTSGLSMKRSLQRFLEKRKTRLQCTSPYPITTLHK
ncbi:hypothetical protein ABFS82_13G082600 [Erythranthe guttata]|uniref:Protein TIFY n=1 Tax=Erythranthe guttata TaxID=4155 RepID=A0A022QZH8_ERYGU|nr:PREDICTED: protein TIFY 5A isoform X1 [Erythranthe guttata]EYU33376.1 hypothetical protein MIMGU_mgv1a016361mg [Erythranthe guttata]|eukprot:XP_012842234.1 PREDICTED: protein TIFY 5A isoform X1 [Erythranthe guttata]